jgi:transposase InsO family protein
MLLRKEKPVRHWCGVFGVSRKTVYKWLSRFTQDGRRGLQDRSRRPQRMPRQLAWRTVKQIERWREQKAHWGAKKIRVRLSGPARRRPTERTIARWLKRLNFTRPMRRRPPRACVRPVPALTRARRPNQVWTVDFKGWFRAGNGARCEPLTVRDLFSRYGLLARVLPTQHGMPVQAVFTRLFRQHGLPGIIRVDNGSPFAARGPAGLSRLSVWWLRLGIRVEFTRPGCPQDNGAHEQFHGVLKRETTQPAAWTRQGQQHRMTTWLRRYNRERPHEALAQTVPAKRYGRSRRKFPERLPEIRYGKKYVVRHVRSNGEIRWAGRKRFIGEAFVGQALGLSVLQPGVYAIYFARLLIGHLHERDTGAMRPIVYRTEARAPKKAKV